MACLDEVYAHELKQAAESGGRLQDGAQLRTSWTVFIRATGEQNKSLGSLVWTRNAAPRARISNTQNSQQNSVLPPELLREKSEKALPASK